MAEVINATRPEANIVVHAAAGTGKTWLLTSRVMRLLLSGVQPGAILAITFTRRAAAEIEQRVMQRLLEMAVCDAETLKGILAQLGCEPSKATTDSARRLYESLLVSEHPLKVTTFHAFCQDLLQRFTLESGLPPGFRIVENTAQLLQQAWRNFENNLRNYHHKVDLASFETLLRHTGNPQLARSALFSFLQQRSDWWAFVEDEANAVDYARKQFEQLLASPALPDQSGPDALSSLRKNIYRYDQLLAPVASATIAKRLRQLQDSSLQTLSDFIALNRANSVFRDSKNRRRKFSRNKTTLKNLGEKRLDELCALEVSIQQQLDDLLDQEKRKNNCALNYAWFHCGHLLLEEYQSLKKHLQVLDFADLEWQAYRLLNQNEFAHWVQFKLDQRIDHLLIDEFQDTNPTQWHLIHPLLAEMASAQSDRSRSAFIVGDIKQSIYRFRRAAPGLFRHASDWMAANLGADSVSQQKSYRSSPAIIKFVNLLFDHHSDSRSEPDLGSRFHLDEYVTHDAYHRQRWGKVELLPLVKRQQPVAADDKTGFRNPLATPRRQSAKLGEIQHRQEAALIVNRIKSLLGTAIDDDGTPRALHYGDIMILMRSRTHTAIYETELRRAGIPFSSASKNQFLAALEIKDVVNLLRALLKPFDNLALASALRSPIFSCSNQTLISLARLPHPWWWQRLRQLAATADNGDPVHRAFRLLSQWRELVNKIPVHDLLDKIFQQSNMINRYLAGAPDHVRSRIEGNLNHLLELTLEVDSGRYPGLNQFVSSLSFLGDDNSPMATSETEHHVRLMTIHGAKGLEAPVVFLADMARADREHPASHRAISHWPHQARKPETFLLVGKKSERDIVSEIAYDTERQADMREEANLLYVALTRARQYLYISGCEPRSKDHGWYGFILSRLEEEKPALQRGFTEYDIQMDDDDVSAGSPLILSFGQPAAIAVVPEIVKIPATAPEDGLCKPITTLASDEIISPSREKEPQYEITHGDNEHSDIARKRGIWMHRMLQQLTENNNSAAVKKQLQRESRRQLESEAFENYWQTCLQLLGHKKLQPLFQLEKGSQAYNELPVLYRYHGKSVFGIIDRVIINKNQMTLIDYKTHESATAENIGRQAEQFYRQMQYYGDGASQLWPGKTIKLLLLFTACAQTQEIPYPPAT